MNELQWTNKTHFFIKIYLSHFIPEGGAQFVVSLRDRWRDIYSERGLLLAPYLLPWARGCQSLHPLASRIVRDDLWSAEYPWLDPQFLQDSLSKSDRVVLISRGPLLVTQLLVRLNPKHCHPPIYKSQRNSLSKHTGSPGTKQKSMSTVII